MGKFLFGVFIGVMIMAYFARAIVGNGLGNVAIMKHECEESGYECVMVFDFIALENDYEQ